MGINMRRVDLLKNQFKGAQEIATVDHPSDEGVTLTYYDFDDEELLGVMSSRGQGSIFNPKTSHLHMGEKLIKYMDTGDTSLFTKVKRRRKRSSVLTNEEKPQKRTRKSRIVEQESSHEKPKRRERSSICTEVRGRNRRVRSKLGEEESLESLATTSRTSRRRTRSVLRVSES